MTVNKYPVSICSAWDPHLLVYWSKKKISGTLFWWLFSLKVACTMWWNCLPFKVLWRLSGDGVSALISVIRPNIERIFFGIGIQRFYGDFRNARKGNGGQDGEIRNTVSCSQPVSAWNKTSFFPMTVNKYPGSIWYAWDPLLSCNTGRKKEISVTLFWWLFSLKVACAMWWNCLPFNVLWRLSGDGVSTCISAIRPNIERIFFGIGIRRFCGVFRNVRKGNGGQDGEILDAVMWSNPYENTVLNPVPDSNGCYINTHFNH